MKSPVPERRPSRPRPWRILPAGLAALLLGACTSNSNSDWAPLMQMIKSQWTGDNALPLQQVAAVPYATLGMRIGDSSQVMLVLASDSGNELLWVAGHEIAISTRNGRIVKTAGLEYNLTTLQSDAALQTPEDAWTEHSVRFTADLTDPARYSVSISCERSAPVPDTITILGKSISALRINEHCRAPDISWSFTNSYWVSQSHSLVWRSIQHVHPSLDAIEIDTLRPPG
jgi:hypothetical protein